MAFNHPHLGPKTSEVGGGAATGLSDDYFNFLKQGLSSGHFGGQNTGTTPQGGAGGGLSDTGGIYHGGGGGGLGDVLDQFLNGHFGNQKYGVDTSGLKGNQGGGIDFGSFNPSTVDFSKFDSSINTNPYSANITTNPLFSSAMKNAVGAIGGPTGIGPQQSVNITDTGMPGTDAASSYLNRQTSKGVADLRARYGASGGLGLGTPGSSAEGSYLADSNAANANTIANLSRQDAQLRQQGQLGQGQINANMYNSFLNAIGQARGQTISGASSIFGNVAGALGTEANANLGARGQDIDALLKSKGLSLDALKAASQQGIDVQSLLNQFLGMKSQSQMGNRGMDIDALSKALGLDLSGQQLGESARQFNVGEQGNTLQALLNQYMQGASKGTSQRQVVQTPGLLHEVLGGLSGIAGAIAPFAKGGFSFGGSQNGSNPTRGGITDTFGAGGIPAGNGDNTFGQPDYSQISDTFRPITF